MDVSKKLPIYASISQSAQKQADRRSDASPKTMPASVVSVNGQMVTVKFEVESDFTFPQIVVPIFGSEYVRLPIQPGCKGMVIPADFYIGNMSNQGTGKATIRRSGNLSNLVFFPIGNTQWAKVDGNALYMYGVNSVKITDKIGGASLIDIEDNGITISNGSSTAVVTSDSAVIKHGDSSVTADGSGVSIKGTLTINGQAYMAHEHSNGNNGAPTGGVIG